MREQVILWPDKRDRTDFLFEDHLSLIKSKICHVNRLRKRNRVGEDVNAIETFVFVKLYLVIFFTRILTAGTEVNKNTHNFQEGGNRLLKLKRNEEENTRGATQIELNYLPDIPRRTLVSEEGEAAALGRQSRRPGRGLWSCEGAAVPAARGTGTPPAVSVPAPSVVDKA